MRNRYLAKTNLAAAFLGLLMLSSVATSAIGGMTPQPDTPPMTPVKNAQLQDFARRYAAAWCSQKADRVAAFFSSNGSLTINGGKPSVGRYALTQTAQDFMTAFPDMVVAMDGLLEREGKVIFQWTLTGTNTGPGGKGNKVRISGFEEWRIGRDGLVADSQGHYDAAEYQRQIDHGVDGEK